MAKRTAATRRTASSTRSRTAKTSKTRKRATSGRSQTRKSASTGATRRRSTAVDERQPRRDERAQEGPRDIETAPPDATRGDAADARLSPTRGRSSDRGSRREMRGRPSAEGAEGDGGPDRTTGRERQDDEIDSRVMREGSNPRAASEDRER